MPCIPGPVNDVRTWPDPNNTQAPLGTWNMEANRPSLGIRPGLQRSQLKWGWGSTLQRAQLGAHNAVRVCSLPLFAWGPPLRALGRPDPDLLGHEGAPLLCAESQWTLPPTAVSRPWACHRLRGCPAHAGCVVWPWEPHPRSPVTFDLQYRSINHRMDVRSMWLYQWYYSDVCQW